MTAYKVHDHATITASDARVFSSFEDREVYLLVNILSAPTGGSPTLTFTVQGVDSLDGTTVVGPSVATGSLTGVGITLVRLTTATTSLLVSWTVGGSSPSFTNVDVTLFSKAATSTALVDLAGNETGKAANPLRIDPTGTTPQPVSHANLDVALSTRAAEATLASVLAQLDVALSSRASQTTLASVLSQLDVALSTRASQTTAASLETLLTAIRDTAGIKKITDPLPTGTNTIGKTDQGLANTAANRWPVQHTDGTNFLPTADAATRALYARVTDGTNTAAVKAASTAPVASDPAAVVVLSPNDATLASRLADATFTARVNTLGQKTMANSTPVVLASDHSQVPVTFTQTNAVTGVSSANLLLGGGTAGTLQVLRSTPYTEPASAAQRSVGSSSANDTSAGTGARSVVVKYFDGAGDGPFEETVTLNGTTPVNTVATDIRFIESIRVETVGSGGANAGTITLYGSTGGAGGTIGTIAVGTVLAGVGDNTTLWAHHYVPTNWEVEVATLTATIQSGGSGTTGKFFLRVAHPLVANNADVPFDGVMLLSGSFRREYQFKTQIEGFARIVAYAIPGVNNTEISVAFDWSEVPL